MTNRSRSARRAPAFTLLEAALTLVIIGVGVLAMVDAQQAFIQSNLWSSHAATATYLAQEVREFSRNLPRHDPVLGLAPNEGGDEFAELFGAEVNENAIDDIDDIDDLDDVTFGAAGDFQGPISALGEIIPEIAIDGSTETDEEGNVLPMTGWSQQVTVEKVEPFDSSVSRPDDYGREEEVDGLPPLARDEFPLRVTVTVVYTPNVGEPIEMAVVTWIVP